MKGHRESASSKAVFLGRETKTPQMLMLLYSPVYLNDGKNRNGKNYKVGRLGRRMAGKEQGWKERERRRE